MEPKKKCAVKPCCIFLIFAYRRVSFVSKVWNKITSIAKSIYGSVKKILKKAGSLFTNLGKNMLAKLKSMIKKILPFPIRRRIRVLLGEPRANALEKFLSSSRPSQPHGEFDMVDDDMLGDAYGGRRRKKGGFFKKIASKAKKAVGSVASKAKKAAGSVAKKVCLLLIAPSTR